MYIKYFHQVKGAPLIRPQNVLSKAIQPLIYACLQEV